MVMRERISLRHRFPIELLALVFTIYGIGIFLSRSLSGLEDPALIATALTLDLTLLVPALYYWLAVRRRGWPAFSTVPVFFASLFGASLVIPAEHQGFLQSLHFLVPIAEIVILGVLAVAVSRALIRARAGKTDAASSDFLQVAQQTAEKITGNPRFGEALAYELGLFSYAFSRRRLPEMAPHEFTYHRRTALRAITAVFLLIIAVEAIPVHLLLSLWSPAVAWIVMALTIYSAFWLLGDARAMARRPIHVSRAALNLRFGLRWSLEVPWSEIESLQPYQGQKSSAGGTQNKERKKKDRLELVPMGAGPTHSLQLRNPVSALGPYGFRRSIREVAFFVDETQRFDEACRSFLSEI